MMAGDAEDQQRRGAELARRLNLLLDVVVAERGSPVTFREVQEGLAAQGVKLSRARWFYMKEGNGRLVTDSVLLSAICGIFNVDPSYLLSGEETDLPVRIDSQLDFVRSLRAVRVRAFAERALGDVSPETLRVITEYLNKDIGLHPRGEQAAVSLPAGSEDGRPAGP